MDVRGVAVERLLQTKASPRRNEDAEEKQEGELNTEKPRRSAIPGMASWLAHLPGCRSAHSGATLSR